MKSYSPSSTPDAVLVESPTVRVVRPAKRQSLVATAMAGTQTIGEFATEIQQNLNLEGVWGVSAVPQVYLDESITYQTDLPGGGRFARSDHVAVLVTPAVLPTDPGSFSGSAAAGSLASATMYIIPPRFADAAPEIRALLQGRLR